MATACSLGTREWLAQPIASNTELMRGMAEHSIDVPLRIIKSSTQNERSLRLLNDPRQKPAAFKIVGRTARAANTSSASSRAAQAAAA